ncbi:hypothetical protein GCM10010176_071250 [Nonomuraea spiralis]|nr:hypothetical protein GCM10010176_071250 [Nonomuraea spiralis]
MEGKPRKHIPDYFLTTEHGPVVVDVKPGRRLSQPVVAFAFACVDVIPPTPGGWVAEGARAATERICRG